MSESLNTIERSDIIKDIGQLISRVQKLETQVLLNRKYFSTEPTWTAPTMGNSWVNFGAPYQVAGYTLTPGSEVKLRGVIKSGTVNTTIFTLPAGYRPASDRIFSVISNAAVGVLVIQSDGDVILTTGNNTYASLDGVSFYAEA